jgi:hypothetical protein
MRAPRTTARAIAAVVLAASLAGCAKGTPASSVSSAKAPSEASASAPPRAIGSAAAPASPPAPHAYEANPLGLPPRRVKLDPGRRVFTFPEPMMAAAKPGATLVLYAATVTGLDGDDLLIEGKAGPPYKVHAGYVIPVPDEPKVRPGDPVLTEHAGVMKHAVLEKQVKDRMIVRFTDLDSRAPQGELKGARMIRQVDGLAPGNYAALRVEEELRHVLLVSPFEDGAARRWFALGFGGAAMLVDEDALRPIPIRFQARPGDVVLAEWVGAMRRATVLAAVDPAFYSVKYDRAGRPATLGWGLLLKAAPP